MAELILNVPSVELRQPQGPTKTESNWLPWLICALLSFYAFSIPDDRARLRRQEQLITEQDKHIVFLDSALVTRTGELSTANEELGRCGGNLADCEEAYASCDKALIAAESQMKRYASTIRLRTARLEEVTKLFEQEERDHTGTRNDLLASQAEGARADNSIRALNKAILARDEVIADYDDASSLGGFFAAFFGSDEEEAAIGATATDPFSVQPYVGKLASVKTSPKAGAAVPPQPDHAAKVQKVRENAFSWVPLYFLLAYFGFLLLLLFLLLRRSDRRRKRRFFKF